MNFLSTEFCDHDIEEIADYTVIRTVSPNGEEEETKIDSKDAWQLNQGSLAMSSAMSSLEIYIEPQPVNIRRIKMQGDSEPNKKDTVLFGIIYQQYGSSVWEEYKVSVFLFIFVCLFVCLFVCFYLFVFWLKECSLILTTSFYDMN